MSHCRRATLLSGRRNVWSAVAKQMPRRRSFVVHKTLFPVFSCRFYSCLGGSELRFLFANPVNFVSIHSDGIERLCAGFLSSLPSGWSCRIFRICHDSTGGSLSAFWSSLLFLRTWSWKSSGPVFLIRWLVKVRFVTNSLRKIMLPNSETWIGMPSSLLTSIDSGKVTCRRGLQGLITTRLLNSALPNQRTFDLLSLSGLDR